MKCYFCRAQVPKDCEKCSYCKNKLKLTGMELVAAMALLSAEDYTVEAISTDGQNRIIRSPSPATGTTKFAHQTLKNPGGRDPYRVHCDGQFSLDILAGGCPAANELINRQLE